MKIDPKGLSREPSSRQGGESCMIRNEFAKEALRVWTSIETERVIVHGNRELIYFAEREEKVTRNHL